MFAELKQFFSDDRLPVQKPFREAASIYTRRLGWFLFTIFGCGCIVILVYGIYVGSIWAATIVSGFLGSAIAYLLFHNRSEKRAEQREKVQLIHALKSTELKLLAMMDKLDVELDLKRELAIEGRLILRKLFDTEELVRLIKLMDEELQYSRLEEILQVLRGETELSRLEMEVVEKLLLERLTAGKERRSLLEVQEKSAIELSDVRLGSSRQFERLPVYEYLPAGDWKSILEPIEWPAYNFYQKNKLESIPPGKEIVLLPDEQYAYVRVRGNSMNKQNIEDGDYVLIWIKNQANQDDIILAAYVDDSYTEQQATLKRYRILDQNKIELRSESTLNIPPIEGNQKNLTIYGVAIAVLKPRWRNYEDIPLAE